MKSCFFYDLFFENLFLDPGKIKDFDFSMLANARVLQYPPMKRILAALLIKTEKFCKVFRTKMRNYNGLWQ